VKVTGGSGAIDHYNWSFDDSKDAGGIDIPDPKITHRYSPGSHTTTVTVFDKNGTNASLDTTDSICVDGEQLECTPNVVECCLGTCNPEGGCK
jgi:PKD repeat protein